ncbi:flagellar hook-basal body complex protein FliE [Roseibium denhamense]|uniref:Flagellar hook-basal body complex protein FliE n=1 Tax=Roseibium denhamense TaxID=76305 RepID=A0ABY1PEW4_9HYPH|nr:flagellar hook-basal body complex protein FliE [Roseibium denhamense]MTI06255.1 flagellar hook-basal body complex protein FliE [Roseibium denhamense]SMP32907.1 flagellar hook-basal body complex protein FliE [Roseibium denhamense]
MINEISALSASSTDGILKSTSTTRYSAGTPDLNGTEAAAQVSFSDAMAEVSQSAIDRIKQGEATSIAGVDGQASVQQVVEAVMSAEQTLQTAIAIRDKVVTAYQEISRMTI